MITPCGRSVLDRLRVEQGLDPELPWGGRTPRVLTQAHIRFNLVPEGASLNEDSMWLTNEKTDEQAWRAFNGC